MISIQIFLLGLLIASTITGLTTEAIKKLLEEANKPYRSNLLAGIVAAVISLGVGIAYILISDIGFTTSSIICLIALIFMSWLCAMVGYDKVIQAISQFKTSDAKERKSEEQKGDTDE